MNRFVWEDCLSLCNYFPKVSNRLSPTWHCEILNLYQLKIMSHFWTILTKVVKYVHLYSTLVFLFGVMVEAILGSSGVQLASYGESFFSNDFGLWCQKRRKNLIVVLQLSFLQCFDSKTRTFLQRSSAYCSWDWWFLCYLYVFIGVQFLFFAYVQNLSSSNDMRSQENSRSKRCNLEFVMSMRAVPLRIFFHAFMRMLLHCLYQ